MPILTPFGFVSSPSDIKNKYNLTDGELAQIVTAIKSNDKDFLSKYPKDAVDVIGMVFGAVAGAYGLEW